MTTSIAINGRFLTRRITGVERYAHEISRRLQDPKRFISPEKSLGQIKGHLWEQFVLPSRLHSNEILWSPANTSAWMVSNQVVTIHDASVFDHPEWFKPAFAAWTRLSWKILAKRVKAIITVSEFSRERLNHHLKIPKEKFHVIYNGVGKPFESQSQNCIETVKEKYGIKKPYFLFVGTIEPRKNLGMLLKSWEQAKLDTHELILAGGEGSVFAPVEYAAKIVHVSDEDLPALYSGAAAFINPSLYEGFGLTVLEAMACGTPVVASNTSALPEVFGDAPKLVDPQESNQLTEAMRMIIEDKAFANSLREKGFKKAEELSWEKSAAKTQEILQKAGDNHF
jgi:glycosyltransferase involved in cell wall biosynthesis